jgi:hypothetical protein
MRICVLAIAVALAGCATQKTVYLPDGRPGHSINCSGSALSWDLCYQKAGELCKANGYDILAKEGEQGSTISGTQYGVFGGTTMNRTLLIACRSARPQ